MAKSKTKKKGMLKRTKEHHAKVFQALKEIIAAEKWDKTVGDTGLAEQVKAKGIYASHIIVRAVRQEYGIGDAYSRKMAKYAESCK